MVFMLLIVIMGIESLLKSFHDGSYRAKNCKRSSYQLIRPAGKTRTARETKLPYPVEPRFPETLANSRKNTQGSLLVKTTRLIGEVAGLISPQSRNAATEYNPFPNCQTQIIRKRPVRSKENNFQCPHTQDSITPAVRLR